MRQGNIIKGLKIERANEYDTNTYYLIITHCCNLARKDPVELLPCSKLSHYDGMMTRGKNPRKLHFQIDTQWYEVVAHKKILCEPSQAETAVLVHAAEDDERQILQHWLALGYRRQALDTATGEVINELKLKTLVKQCGADLLGIWLSSEPLEISIDSMLLCSIYFVFDSESNFSCHAKSIKTHIDNKAKEGWNITTFIVGDDDFTYREARNFISINFDYLSPEMTPI